MTAMKPTTILYSLLFLITINCTAQNRACPEANKYTMEMLTKVLTEDKNKDFRIESGIQNITMGDIKVLKNADDSNTCRTLKNDGYHHPEDPDIPTTITYFKSDNFYFAIVHFSETILRIENGRIEGNSGPPGAIKIYDTDFNAIGDRIIW